MLRVAINGYGRIGRVAHRVILTKHTSDCDVVAINTGSGTDLSGWAHLLKYDTNYRLLANNISVVEKTGESIANKTLVAREDFLGDLIVDDHHIPVFSQKDPSLLPWKDLSVDVVLECTGHFLTAEKAQLHLNSGAKKVVISAPAKDDSPTFVIGVNDTTYAGQTIISDASCTTNCISAIAKIMDDAFGVQKALMTTIHAYTSDQMLQDGGHHDPRRARAAAQNIVPTSTGATIAATKAVPHLAGKFDGLSIRVPVSVGSLSDFTFLLGRDTTVEEVNTVLSLAVARPEFDNTLEVTTEPLVSSDVIGNEHSSIIDLSLTQVVEGNLVKVVAWYDNEWGYANRLVELGIRISV